ncbi:hypothetical protein ACFFTM_01145 [Pseudoduganella plicata]|uniref:Uncharacterized protein n=1 Tax=Pseudoduganella plicata TaxID=321984 RepID=A0A4P7BD77_9BURK|nr:hypothetical protein [Pseudoduganella plicata]QBQ36631.1 hypothetical protein E1742_10990 [Pseudoduganella plicata]GGY73873.1 hypothetical protein GCM10007388_02710 [Pseudoduganella plicata]
MNLRASLLLLAVLPGTTLADTLRARASLAYDALGATAGRHLHWHLQCQTLPRGRHRVADDRRRPPRQGKRSVPFDLRATLLADLWRTTDRKKPQAQAVSP